MVVVVVVVLSVVVAPVSDTVYVVHRSGQSMWVVRLVVMSIKTVEELRPVVVGQFELLLHDQWFQFA